MLQQMTKPHVDSFNYTLTTGLSDAVKVCSWFSVLDELFSVYYTKLWYHSTVYCCNCILFAVNFFASSGSRL